MLTVVTHSQVCCNSSTHSEMKGSKLRDALDLDALLERHKGREQRTMWPSAPHKPTQFTSNSAMSSLGFQGFINKVYCSSTAPG